MMRTNDIRHIEGAVTRQAGFTLVELMVAITVSLMMMVALVSLLVNVNRNNDELERVNTQIENGRFALQLLRDDVMQAGFWGPYMPAIEDRSTTAAPAAAVIPAAVPDPCQDPATWTPADRIALTGIPIQASPSAPGSCGGVVASKKENTDVLVVRRAENCAPGEANCDAFSNGRMYFQAAFCPTQGAGSNFVLDSILANLNMQTGACSGTLAPMRKYISHMYWIRNFANTTSDGIPTLVRSEFDLAGGSLSHQPAVALIEGIEGFNVEFGVDNTVTRCNLNTAVNYTQAPAMVDPATCVASSTAALNTLPNNRGDGIPDGDFVRCTAGTPCTADQLMNTVAAKLYVLARSKDKTQGHTDTKTYNLGSVTLGPFNDNYKRHVFSTTVRLVNVAGRRETP
ncbi:PilW family protein [Noviherbaspirillum sp. ST9]|uniref:PilW family protein n=1 Tax=Noviherbaspirillum sp. ST9 TaxID=3401606 RepID=UPI003B586FD7